MVRVGVGIGVDDDGGDDDKIWVGGCISIYVCLRTAGKDHMVMWSNFET